MFGWHCWSDQKKINHKLGW